MDLFKHMFEVYLRPMDLSMCLSTLLLSLLPTEIGLIKDITSATLSC